MAQITPQLVEERIQRFGKLWMIDDLIRERGRDAEQVPILGYPRFKDDAADYEFFTGKELDLMVDEACRSFVKKGFQVNAKKTVALYASSDLSFIVTFFALFRLGYKVLTMSIRLGPPACLHLLEKADCDTIIHGSTARIDSTLAGVSEARPDVKLVPMLQRPEFDNPSSADLPPFTREIPDRDAEHISVVLTAHSSGSTGLPKPLILSHRGLLNTVVSGTGLKAFNALPWYHLHGLITSIQAMWMRRTAHLYNANLPLTASNLVSALKVIKPEICHCVPYALKLIAEEPEGVEVLKQCRHVTSAGAKTPDELGDKLVKEGINLGLIFGLTEVGHMGDSIRREPGDDSWAYIRPYANLKDHMFFNALEDGTHESVYLKSHPALMVSNSSNPPGSFHSKDLFVPHPTIENAWKYVARHDDRITLLTGEKILPLGMEGTVRDHGLVRDALMVGIDRPVPGMLVFRAQAAADMSEDEFMKAIWPAVEQANAMADEFARLTPEMVVSVPADVEYPATDKNNIIRAAAYQLFEDRIDAMYDRLENGVDEHHNGQTNGTNRLALSIPDLEKFITDTFKAQVGIELHDVDADFFASGVDSLRAIQMRKLLQTALDLGGQLLPTNVVYDARTTARLARVLFAMRQGQPLTNGSETSTSGHDDQIAIMEDLIARYSVFNKTVTGTQPAPDGEHVILTGATGALGAHLLHQLLLSPATKSVTCLSRGPSAESRVHTSLRTRGIDLTTNPSHTGALSKLTILETADLSLPNLGLDTAAYTTLCQTTTVIIHAAWPVNFALATPSFEPHLAGLHALLSLALASPLSHKPRLVFASSISTAFNHPSSSLPIPETPLPSLAAAASTGYARSKLVAERVCEAAAAARGGGGGGGVEVKVLRVGQIVGDRTHGMWNDKEAVPLMVRSVLEVEALPSLEGPRGECRWLPVDVVAGAVLDLAGVGVETRGYGNGVLDVNGATDGVTNGTASNGVNGVVNGVATNGMDGALNGTAGAVIKMNGAASNGTANGDHTEVKARFYHVTTSKVMSWNEDVLPRLAKAGLKFETVPFDDWLSKLRARGEELGAKAEKRLPALKLASYYEQTYGPTSAGEGVGVVFENTEACRESPALRECPDVAKAGLVEKFVDEWMKDWQP